MSVKDDLLFTIRQHAGFKELLASVEVPKIKPYKQKDAAQIENSRAQWIFESGQLDQHKRWLMLLTGKEENS